MRLKPQEAADRIGAKLGQMGHEDLHVRVDESVVGCYAATLTRRDRAANVNFPLSVVEDDAPDPLFETTLDEALRRLSGPG